MEQVSVKRGMNVEMVHKKIYLADSQLAWEHEQFAMNKLAGMTVSTLNSHKSPLRTSVLDRRWVKATLYFSLVYIIECSTISVCGLIHHGWYNLVLTRVYSDTNQMICSSSNASVQLYVYIGLHWERFRLRWKIFPVGTIDNLVEAN